MTTTPLPPTKHDHPDVHTMIWTQSELVWIQNRDAQWQAYATQARAYLEAELDALGNTNKQHVGLILSLEAENKRLREALERIESMCAAPPNFSDATIQEVARTALEDKP